MYYKMAPGDSRTLKRNKKSAMVLALGVWVKRRRGETQIHVSGNDRFHTIIVDQPGSQGHHATLFRHLRQVLLDNGCWLPSESEIAVAAQSRPSKVVESHASRRSGRDGQFVESPHSIAAPRNQSQAPEALSLI